MSRAGKFGLRIVGVLALCVVALGVVVWREPVWVGRKLTEWKMSRLGISEHYMMIGGHRIHYVDGGGSGPAVVLVHGLGSYGEQDWAGLVPYLVNGGYHVYAPDLLGFGKSEQPADSSYSIPEQAKLVEQFLDAEHLESISLSGVSMGGWVASEVALEQPARVKRLMLFDSAGMDFQLSFDRALFTPQSTEDVTKLIALVTPNPPRVPEFLKADALRASRQYAWVTRRALDSMMAGKDYLDEKFSALKMPMLLIWGREDAMTPLRLGEEMHARATQSTLAIYEGCGHIAVFACADRIAPTMMEFLKDGVGPGQIINVAVAPAH